MTESSTTLEMIDQRLDALDRALLGLISRDERVKFVANIESKLRALLDSNPESITELSSAAEEVAFVQPTGTRREARTTPRKRSRLALSSGILGIVAFSLMLALPITYFIVVMIAEAIGEIPAVALLSLNILAVAFGGAVAIAMSIAALVRLSFKQNRKRGMGWAITGLCTAPVPMLVGAVATLVFTLPMVIEIANNSNQSFDVPMVAQEFSPPPLTNVNAPVSPGCEFCPVPPPTLPISPGATKPMEESRPLISQPATYEARAVDSVAPMPSPPPYNPEEPSSY